MKLIVNRKAFSETLGLAAAVAPNSTPKDILKYVHLAAGPDGVSLTATDQEIGIKADVDPAACEISEPGSTLLPTKRVQQMVRETTDETIVLNAEGKKGRLTFKGAHAEFALSVPDVEEFPLGNYEIGPAHRTLKAADLRRLIAHTVFATDVESTRYALGGVLVNFEGTTCTLAATDSRRLAVDSGPCETVGEIPEPSGESPVIPAKGMDILARTLGATDARVDLRKHDVLIDCGQATVYTRLVEGRFPRWQDVIPKEFNAELELIAGPLHAVVRQAMIVTSEESRGVDFTFEPDGRLVLKSVSADVGTSEVELPISYSGPQLMATFDPRFIAEFLKVLNPEDLLTWKLIDGESAALLSAGDSYRYVIMPLSREGR